MTNEKTKKLVLVALLSAIVIVIQIFFSNISIGIVTLSFMLVPIVIAACFVGPLGGAIVGLVSGLTTLIQVFTSGNAFYVMLVTVNPFMTAVTCLLKTTAAGLISGLLYKIFSAKTSQKSLAILAPAAICPIVNTGLFCISMLIFFKEGVANLFGSSVDNIVYLVFIGLAGINFVFELILNLILCPIIGKALMSATKTKKYLYLR